MQHVEVLLRKYDLLCVRACGSKKKPTPAVLRVGEDYLCSDCAYDLSCEIRSGVRAAERQVRRMEEARVV